MKAQDIKKEALYKAKRFEALWSMMTDLQTALAWAKTPQERQAIHDRINEVMAAMNDHKARKGNS